MTVLGEALSSPLIKAKRFAHAQLVVQKNLMLWIAGKRPPSAILLRNIFEELGTTYIKLGQLITSMPSVFPEDYVNAFEGCLDQTTPLPFTVIDKVIRKELGDTRQIFSYIDASPLASASIAQVHAAQLATGEEVVIKVQRPNAENIIKADLSLVHQVTRLLQVIVPKLRHLSLADMAEEIRHGMLEECDFRQEANNLKLYAEFIRARDYQNLVVPKVFPAASSRRVLTMERLQGKTLTHTETPRLNDPKLSQSLSSAMQAWFDSVQNCEIFHADLHSSNIMALNDNRIGFIDFGIVGRISPSIWQAIEALMIALPEENFSAVAEALAALGATHQSVDTEALANDLRDLYLQQQNTAAGIGELDQLTQNTITQLGGIAHRHGIKFPRAFTLLLKQFLYFDRLSRYLSADFDPLLHAFDIRSTPLKTS